MASISDSGCDRTVAEDHTNGYHFIGTLGLWMDSTHNTKFGGASIHLRRTTPRTSRLVAVRDPSVASIADVLGPDAVEGLGWIWTGRSSSYASSVF